MIFFIGISSDSEGLEVLSSISDGNISVKVCTPGTVNISIPIHIILCLVIIINNCLFFLRVYSLLIWMSP